MQNENEKAALDAGEAAQAAALARNIALNAAVAELDEQIQKYVSDPAMQMGMLMLVQALAFRRVLAARSKVLNRGQRHKIVRAATEDFERKLRQYAIDRADEDVAVEAPAMPADDQPKYGLQNPD